jgi:hypothetical protein
MSGRGCAGGGGGEPADRAEHAAEDTAEEPAGQVITEMQVGHISDDLRPAALVMSSDDHISDGLRQSLPCSSVGRYQ